MFKKSLALHDYFKKTKRFLLIEMRKSCLEKIKKKFLDEDHIVVHGDVRPERYSDLAHLQQAEHVRQNGCMHR